MVYPFVAAPAPNDNDSVIREGERVVLLTLAMYHDDAMRYGVRFLERYSSRCYRVVSFARCHYNILILATVPGMNKGLLRYTLHYLALRFSSYVRSHLFRDPLAVCKDMVRAWQKVFLAILRMHGGVLSGKKSSFDWIGSWLMVLLGVVLIERMVVGWGEWRIE